MDRKKQAEAPVGATQFVPRYPAIEKLIDSEDFNGLNKNAEQAYKELEHVAKQKGLGKAREARKAMRALERVMDLLTHLLKLKYQYMESMGQETKGGEKSPGKKISGDKQLQETRLR